MCKKNIIWFSKLFWVYFIWRRCCNFVDPNRSKCLTLRGQTRPDPFLDPEGPIWPKNWVHYFTWRRCSNLVDPNRSKCLTLRGQTQPDPFLDPEGPIWPKCLTLRGQTQPDPFLDPEGPTLPQNWVHYFTWRRCSNVIIVIIFIILIFLLIIVVDIFCSWFYFEKLFVVNIIIYCVIFSTVKFRYWSFFCSKIPVYVPWYNLSALSKHYGSVQFWSFHYLQRNWEFLAKFT